MNIIQTPFKDYIIPQDILEKAKALNASLPTNNMNDRRTKGVKFLGKWAEEQDKKNFPELFIGVN